MKYWVFDLDETLVDSLTVHFHVLEKVFSKFGLEFTKAHHEEVLKVSSKTLAQYFEFRLGKENVKTALTFFEELTSMALKEIRPFDGINDLLETLKSKNRGLAVWTARDLKATKAILKNSGLEPFFSICISGCCVEQSKPHPEGLQKIADYFKSSADEMIIVGDFDSDMLGAQAFGAQAIRVTWHPFVENKKCEIARWHFHGVDNLHTWIKTAPF